MFSLCMILLCAFVSTHAASEITRDHAVSKEQSTFKYIRVGACFFNEDLTLVSFVSDEYVHLFDLVRGIPIQRFSANPPDMNYGSIGVWATAIDPGKKWIYTIDERNNLVAWKISPGDGIKEHPNLMKLVDVKAESALRMSLDPDGMAGRAYASTGFSRDAKYCALAGKVFSIERAALLLDTKGSSVSFSADGLHVLAYGGDLGKMIELYSLSGDDFVLAKRIQGKGKGSNPLKFNGIAYEPARGWIAQVMHEGIGVWDLETGDVLGTMKFQEPDHIEFNPDGNLLRISSDSGGGYSMGAVFTTDTFEQVADNMFKAQFSADGRSLVCYDRDPNIFIFYKLPQALPYLELDVAFDDDASGGNGKLDSGETAAVILTISNTGQGSAVGIEAVSSIDNTDVTIAEHVPLGAIPAGLKREIRIPVTADPAAITGNVRVHIETTELNGFNAQPVEFDMMINRVEPPLLAVKGEVLVDDTPSAQAATAYGTVADQMASLARLDGNSDGILENGETARISIPVINEGAGTAYSVAIEADDPIQLVHLESNLADVGDIAPGAAGRGEFVIHVDKSYPHDTLALPVTIVDVRPSVEPVQSSVILPYKKLEPVIDFTYRVRDGGTEASRGNGNGIVEQGEFIELGVTLTNTGTAPATGLTATLLIQKEGIVIGEGTATIGDLAVNETASEVLLTFMVQRSASPGPLSVKLDLETTDYPRDSWELNLAIRESGIVEVELQQAIPETGDEIWIPVGLHEIGTVWDLLIDPVNKRTVYLATEGSGVVVSQDRGLTWREMNEGLVGRSIRCLAMGAPHILLAGSVDQGVYRFEEDKATWMLSSKGIDKVDGRYPICRKLNIARGQSETVYLGTDQGLYVSKNLGGKWSKSSKLPGSNVIDLAFLAGFGETLLVSLGEGLVCRSGDQGSSWESIFTDGLLEGITETVFGLATDPKNEQRMFLSAGLSGILRSLDGGQNWTQLGKGMPSGGDGTHVSIGSILINPVNPTIIYAGSTDGRLFESSDDGESWNPVGFGSFGKNGVGTSLLRMDNDGNLFAGGQSGLFQLGGVRSKESIGNVIFSSNSSEILPEIAATLTGIIELLKSDMSLQAIVEGHTDNVGSLDTNMKLSQKRSDEVRAYLEKQGIMPERIVSRGFAWDRPVDTNETPEGRKHNRRVEIMLVGPKMK